LRFQTGLQLWRTLSDSEDVNRAWENIKENIKTSAKESLGLHKLKQRKLWFDEECLGFVDQTKQAKMQWVEDPNQSSVVCRHFRSKQKEYLKAKIDETETNSNIKNIRNL
jgi:hypothetical protein